MLRSRVRVPEGVLQRSDGFPSDFFVVCYRTRTLTSPPLSKGDLGGMSISSTRLPAVSSAVESLRGYCKDPMVFPSDFFIILNSIQRMAIARTTDHLRLATDANSPLVMHPCQPFHTASELYIGMFYLRFWSRH